MNPPMGGLVSGTNVPLISYIDFAYHLAGNQLQLLFPNLLNWLISISQASSLGARIAGRDGAQL
jgi:hypothetical protein